MTNWLPLCGVAEAISSWLADVASLDPRPPMPVRYVARNRHYTARSVGLSCPANRPTKIRLPSDTAGFSTEKEF
jgi:hypothetical protein